MCIQGILDSFYQRIAISSIVDDAGNQTMYKLHFDYRIRPMCGEELTGLVLDPRLGLCSTFDKMLDVSVRVSVHTIAVHNP